MGSAIVAISISEMVATFVLFTENFIFAFHLGFLKKSGKVKLGMLVKAFAGNTLRQQNEKCCGTLLHLKQKQNFGFSCAQNCIPAFFS